MDEMKIQLDNKSDIDYVVSNIKSHTMVLLESKLQKINKGATSNEEYLSYKSEIEKKIDQLVENVAGSIQINGSDLSKLYDKGLEQQEEYEPLNESLFKELSEKQAAYESLLYSTIEKRKAYPIQIEKNMQEALTTLGSLYQEELQNAENSQEAIHSNIMNAISKLKDELGVNKLTDHSGVLSNLHGSLASLNALEKLVEKLKRAQTVMHEEKMHAGREMSEEEEALDDTQIQASDDDEGDDGRQVAQRERDIKAGRNLLLSMDLARKLSRQ